jgi:hypothetical protein
MKIKASILLIALCAIIYAQSSEPIKLTENGLVLSEGVYSLSEGDTIIVDSISAPYRPRVASGGGKVFRDKGKTIVY